MGRDKIEMIGLGFLIGALFIAIVYIIFPNQRPHKINTDCTPSQEMTQILEILNK